VTRRDALQVGAARVDQSGQNRPARESTASHPTAATHAERSATWATAAGLGERPAALQNKEGELGAEADGIGHEDVLDAAAGAAVEVGVGRDRGTVTAKPADHPARLRVREPTRHRSRCHRDLAANQPAAARPVQPGVTIELYPTHRLRGPQQSRLVVCAESRALAGWRRRPRAAAPVAGTA
jgi:hypothetical protein